MKVSDLMNTKVVTVPPEMSAADAAQLMDKYDIGVVPVCSGSGQLQGMLTDRDIVIRCVASRSDPKNTKVSELMTRSVVTVSPDDDVHTAARVMSGEQVRRVPVADNERLVGILSLADISHSDIYTIEAAKALTGITETESAF